MNGERKMLKDKTTDETEFLTPDDIAELMSGLSGGDDYDYEQERYKRLIEKVETMKLNTSKDYVDGWNDALNMVLNYLRKDYFKF